MSRQIFPYEEEPTLWDDMILITGLVLDGLVAYADEAIAEVHEQHFGVDVGLDLHTDFQGYTGPMWGRLPDGRYCVQGQPGVMSEEQFNALQESIQQWEGYGMPHPHYDFDPADMSYNFDLASPDQIRQEIEGNWTPQACDASAPDTGAQCDLAPNHRGPHEHFPPFPETWK